MTAQDKNVALRFESFENRLAAYIERELRKQTIILFRVQVTVIITMAALVFLVVRFT